jgi:hypothetical protein
MAQKKDTGKVDIRGKEYSTVAYRIAEFRKNFPNHSLITELIEATADTVLVKAFIYAPVESVPEVAGRLVATGLAEENRKASQINRTSAVENAETSAIGRALASFGLGGTEFASADELANALQQQATGEKNPEKPAKPKPAPAKEPETIPLATEADLKSIAAARKAGGHTAEDAKTYVENTFGVTKATELLAQDVPAIVKRLKDPAPLNAPEQPADFFDDGRENDE